MERSMALSILWKLAPRKLTIDTNLGQQVPIFTKAGAYCQIMRPWHVLWRSKVPLPASVAPPLYVRLLTLAIVSWLFDYVGIRFNSYN